MFAITDKCKNPAAAFRLADMWCGNGDVNDYTFQNYLKGVTWEEPSSPNLKSAVGYDVRYKNIAKVATPGEPDNTVWDHVTAQIEVKEKRLYCENSGDIRDPDNYESYLNVATRDYMKFRPEYEQILPAWISEEAATNLGNTFTAINDYVKASIVDFITGKTSLDTDWQKYLDGLNKLGYTKYVDDFAASRAK